MELQKNTPTLPNGTAFVEHELREVDAVIKERLSSGVPLVGDVAQHIIAAGGKRLRPTLLLLCCGALGFEGAQRLIHIVIANNSLQAQRPSSRQIC